MAILQVRSVPDELYAAAKARAAEEGMTLSDLVIAALGRELERPTVARWATDMRRELAGRPIVEIDVPALLDAVRDDPEATQASDGSPRG